MRIGRHRGAVTPARMINSEIAHVSVTRLMDRLFHVDRTASIRRNEQKRSLGTNVVFNQKNDKKKKSREWRLCVRLPG